MSSAAEDLTLFDMGGGHDGHLKCFWPLCPNVYMEEAETWWLLTLIYVASKKVIFGSLGYLVLPWQRVCQGVLEIFWSFSFLVKFFISLILQYKVKLIIQYYRARIYISIIHCSLKWSGQCSSNQTGERKVENNST